MRYSKWITTTKFVLLTILSVNASRAAAQIQFCSVASEIEIHNQSLVDPRFEKGGHFCVSLDEKNKKVLWVLPATCEIGKCQAYEEKALNEDQIERVEKSSNPISETCVVGSGSFAFARLPEMPELRDYLKKIEICVFSDRSFISADYYYKRRMKRVTREPSQSKNTIAPKKLPKVR